MDSIFIIGAPRSGTTMLGKILSECEGVVYIEEPNVIWRYKNWAKVGHEQFSEDDASDDVVKFIRKWFENEAAVAGADVVIEKTPANAIRPFFVKKIFPEGRVVLLFRDFNSVVNSIVNKWISEDDKNALLLGEVSRFRQFGLQFKKFLNIPWIDYPWYASLILSELKFKLFGSKRRYWGPQYKDYRNDLYREVHDLAAIQWLQCMRSMLNYAKNGAPEVVVNYDDIVGGKSSVEGICKTLGLVLFDANSSVAFKKMPPVSNVRDLVSSRIIGEVERVELEIERLFEKSVKY